MLRKSIYFACFAAILAVSASLLIQGCTVSPVSTPPVVLTTRPSTQPTTQPAVIVVTPPALQTADKAADFVVQHSDLIYAILTLLGVSAAGHATNITKTVAGVYKSFRTGTATAESVAVAGTQVATEVAAMDPKTAPAINAVESVVNAASSAAPPKTA